MKEILEILNDVKSSITGELGICGSLAQRFLVPELPSLKEKPAEKSDLDLLLIPTEHGCEVLPSIKEKFTIIEISPSNEAYYFGLIHKKTKKWVDLFPKENKKGLVPIEVEGITYLAEGVENQIVHLTKDILRRNSHNLPVRKKWIIKLNELYSCSGLDKDSLSVSETEIQKALKAKPTSKLVDWLLTTKELFKNKTVTSNGLSAEPTKFHFK